MIYEEELGVLTIIKQSPGEKKRKKKDREHGAMN